MSRAQAATELAVFDALTAGVTLSPVFGDVPAETRAPVTIVGDMVADPLPAKNSLVERLSLTVTTEVWAMKRAPILLLQDEVKQALHGRTLIADGYEIQIVLDAADARKIAEQTYFGESHFILFVSPA